MKTIIKKSDSRYSYADYLGWKDGQRWEILDGIAYNMSPSPSRRHQKVSQILSRELGNYLKGESCEIYSAPFDVRLPLQGEGEMETINVVQPDIVVVCDKAKLDDRGCHGAPDLIIEIISPSTAKMDMVYKLNLYERAGVKEYWIVHPLDNTIMAFVLADHGKYGRYDLYEQSDHIPVHVLPDIVVDLHEIFAE